jgi:hypothetical protein
MCVLCHPLLAQQREATISTTRIDYLPAPTQIDSRVEGKGLDTLMDCMMRSTGLVLYSFSDPKDPEVTHPVTGTNSLYGLLGQKYAFTGSADVVGMLIGYAMKAVNGKPDTIMVIIGASDGTDGLPKGNFTGMETFTADAIDTSSTSLRFTTINFAKPAPINSNFVALLQTQSMESNDPGDETAIFSNVQGDGMGERRPFYIAMNDSTGQMTAGNLGDLFNVAGKPLDVDLVFLPILQLGTQSADVPYPTIDGVTLKGAYPNPSVDRTTIGLSLDRPSPVEIRLIDMRGNVVRTIRNEKMEAGAHEIGIDLNGIEAGSYVYTITTSGTQVAGKMTVAK